MHDKDHKGTCMACSCPCEMHTEHSHEGHSHNEGGKENSAKKCEMCGHEHKADGSCDCGCK